MKKRKDKKEYLDEELDLLEDESNQDSFINKLNINPIKIFAFFLILFSFFSFSALFGLGGNFGRIYFTFVTDFFGIYAYTTPFIYIFFSYIILAKKAKLFLNLNLWLFIFIIIDIYIALGFFNITGSFGGQITNALQISFGTIPTLFVLFITATLVILRIFETSLSDLFGHHFQNSNKPLQPVTVIPQTASSIPKIEVVANEEIFEDEYENEQENRPGFFSRFFFGKKSEPQTVAVNHLEDFENKEDEYEEIEVEEENNEPEDYRSDMYKAISANGLAIERQEKMKVKKLIKKEVIKADVSVIKQNEEKLRQLNEKYSRPPLSMYTEDTGKASAGDNKENARIIKRTLADFGISVEMDEVTVGPTVTRYALKPAQGVKIEKIMNLSNNIALELSVPTVSIIRVHERSLIGVEVPNKNKAKLGLSSLLANRDFLERKDKLTMTLGKDIYGDPVFADMAKMPHLLVAGTTGSGKSVLVHAIINSLIYKNSPYDLKFILVDPKKVELALYNNLPHLYTPVIKDPKKAVQTLEWLVQEMDRRYAILEECGKQNIASYHQHVLEKYKRVEGRTSNEKLPEKMPYIVLVIDELADFMMKYPKQMESGIVKLAQMSRAVGIHLILATQRPSTNIITGVIKGNIPSRVALRVASQVDSRVILDQGGAEKLLGYGDLLFINADSSNVKRVQSPFVSEEEIKDVVAYLREEYDDVLTEDLKTPDGNIVGAQNISQQNGGEAGIESDEDFNSLEEKYEEAKELVLRTGKTSVSNIQVKLGTGYARSKKIMDMLERAGVILTTTDNTGKSIKVVAGYGAQGENKVEVAPSNEREDILKIVDENPQT